MFHLWLHFTLLQSSIWAFVTALLITLCLGKVTIKWLQKGQIGQVVRDDGPQSHLKKTGTPTMGGVLILFAITVATLLWADLKNPYIWIALLTMIAIGALGWLDDWRKLVLKNSKGVSAKFKILWQTIVALVAGYAIYHFHQNGGALWVPVCQHWWLLGLGFIPFAWLVIVGSSNAVNLTDGLDGLVIVPVVFVALGLATLTHLEPHAGFVGSDQMIILSGAVIGSGIGFLWFNSYPAEMFMGDVGALALGALLAVMALVIGQEWVFAVMAGLFIIEALSVMLQVGSYKLTKKRIFKMAPIHHHFELLGWFETKVTVRFWIIALLFLLLGLLIGFS